MLCLSSNRLVSFKGSGSCHKAWVYSPLVAGIQGRALLCHQFLVAHSVALSSAVRDGTALRALTKKAPEGPDCQHITERLGIGPLGFASVPSFPQDNNFPCSLCLSSDSQPLFVHHYSCGRRPLATQCFTDFACCARIVLPFDLARYSCLPSDELGEWRTTTGHLPGHM